MPSNAQFARIVANDASVGVSPWSGLTNIAASDNLNAQVNNNPGQISQYLKQTSYPFVIPVNAGIVGVEYYIERHADGAGRTEDWYVYLVVDGVVVGSNKAVAGSWPASDAGYTYGGPTDLWGLGYLSRSQVLANNFGVVLATKETEDKSDSDSSYIDVAYMRVYWELLYHNFNNYKFAKVGNGMGTTERIK